MDYEAMPRHELIEEIVAWEKKFIKEVQERADATVRTLETHIEQFEKLDAYNERRKAVDEAKETLREFEKKFPDSKKTKKKLSRLNDNTAFNIRYHSNELKAALQKA